MVEGEEFNFINTKDAAKVTGYTHDYIGQLSRKGYFKSKKVGRKLFVDLDGLLAYKELGESSKKLSEVPTSSLSEVKFEKDQVKTNLQSGAAEAPKSQKEVHRAQFGQAPAFYSKLASLSENGGRAVQYASTLLGKHFAYVTVSALVLVISVSFTYGLKDAQFAQSTFEQVKTASSGKLLAGLFDFDYKKLLFWVDTPSEEEVDTSALESRLAQVENEVGEVSSDQDDITISDDVAISTSTLTLLSGTRSARGIYGNGFLEFNTQLSVNDGLFVRDYLTVNGIARLGSAIIQGPFVASQSGKSVV